VGHPVARSHVAGVGLGCGLEGLLELQGSQTRFFPDSIVQVDQLLSRSTLTERTGVVAFRS
jgi:hypothetical protein